MSNDGASPSDAAAYPQGARGRKHVLRFERQLGHWCCWMCRKVATRDGSHLTYSKHMANLALIGPRPRNYELIAAHPFSEAGGEG
eukprot:11484243-Alexandrium_andersonii.AAC.1